MAGSEHRPCILEAMVPTLYLLCGLPGSGKTTRAKELEAAGKGVLLNADDWVSRLYPDDAEAAARDERKISLNEFGGNWSSVY